MLGPDVVTGVLRELARPLPSVVRWQPVVAGWVLAAGVLTWKASSVDTPAGEATLLRVVGVLLVTGVVHLVDDAAANVLAPVPVPLAWRVGVRCGLAAVAVAVPWAGALLLVRPGDTAAALTLEVAALTALGLAVASGVAHWSNAREAGLAAAPAVLGAAAFAALLPARWAMYPPPGSEWRDAHTRWAVVLAVAAAVLAATMRDPAHPRRPSPPPSPPI